MADVVVFGLGDLAELATFHLEEDGCHRVVAFTAHDHHIKGSGFLRRPVAPFETLATTHPSDAVRLFVAVGYRRVNRDRAHIVEQCRALGYRLLGYVSPSARVPRGFVPRDNTFVFEGAIVQPFAAVGEDVVLWSGCHVGHHSVVEDHAFLAPHATLGGRVRVGRGSFVGANATVRNGVSLGAETVVGAGAVILEDTGEATVHRGVGAELLGIPSDVLGEL